MLIMARIGYIGLGAMGGRVTKRLLDAGHAVTGYNRTRDKAQWLLDAGMQWGSSPRAVAEQADVVFTMVTNTTALEAVTGGPDGLLAGLGPNKVYCDMSTVSPAKSRQLAQQVAMLGARMLDTPVSGSVITLEQGKLSLMVGGERATFERMLPILQDIGPKVTYVGENGLAVLMKIGVNLNLQIQFIGFLEGLFLAEKGGIPRETAMEVLLSSVVASPSLSYRAPFIQQMPEEAWFNVNMMQKDMLLALEMGRELNVPLPTVALTNEFLTAARSMGLEQSDFSVEYRVLAKLAGIDVGE
jgi:3-hydroxyisobutyrate dehydrogenase-like beta-hydroxyacid dehydrogenase